VLAAGASSRFGGGKLSSPWRDGALIDGALGAAFAAPVETVVVVTGADAQVEPAARRWAAAQAQSARLAFVHADDHAQGMGASLRAGAAALPAGCGGVFVFLGDMPLIPHGLAARLAAALAGGALAAAPVHEHRRGHPILFGPALIAGLASSRGDEGARHLLQALGPALALVETPDPGILADVDRPQDTPE
jgi:molybdenum cofactor cytidylyltransferase